MRDSESEKNQCRTRKAGLTRVTKLVIIAFLGFLTLEGILATKHGIALLRMGKINATKETIEGIEEAVYMFSFQHIGRLPDSLQELTHDTVNGEPGLLKENALRDVWGTPFRYTKQDTTFTITSAGPDKDFGTADDISQTKVKEET